MRVLVVIPARLESTRLARKALADIHGAPMVVRTWQRARLARRPHGVLVATDHADIAAAVEAAGGRAVLTGECASGSDRVWQAARGTDAELIVNVQGDEPLLDPAVVDALVEPFADPRVQVATVAAPLRVDPALPSVVKVVTDLQGDAVHFSRAPLAGALHHVGCYAFRRSALESFVSWEPTPLERAERLEQLRFLEHGIPVRVVRVASASTAVDTLEDLEQVRSLFMEL